MSADDFSIRVERIPLVPLDPEIVEAAAKARAALVAEVGKPLVEAYEAASSDLALYGEIRPETLNFLRAALEDEIVPGEIGPSRAGSTRCESGSIASGGTREFCTCDACF